MFCSQCGTNLPDNAAFCPSCGTRQAVAAAAAPQAAPQPVQPPRPAQPPQPPVPTVCPACGSAVQPGRRFCTRCGASMTGEAPARRARPRASGSLQAYELLMAGGFALAVIGTLLEWISFGPEGVSGWNTDSRFRIAEWLGVTAPIDAAAIAIVAAGGAYLLLGSRFGLQVPALPFGPSAAGGVIAALGVLEWLYIDDVGQGLVDPGIGIYAVIVAGLIAVGARFLSGLKLSG
jgi:predicted nucleic acid-binding Zn ribbon protein